MNLYESSFGLAEIWEPTNAIRIKGGTVERRYKALLSGEFIWMQDGDLIASAESEREEGGANA